ncbi:MAG: NAD-dependent 4,6-dehydratase LegB [Bacteriovoracia bacterium]
MRYLVTGADGFIGSHLTEFLVSRGVDVRAVCLYNSFNSWGWLDSSPSKNKVEVITGDVRDPRFCREAVQGVDVVMHLAALIAIPYSYRAPDSYVDTNIKGTLNMVSAAMDAGVKKFLHTSTSEVYGTARQVPIPETHPLQPQSPYSASKIAADMMALSFYNSFKFPVTVVRPFNTYGPRQSARAVIPTIISQLAAGKKEIQLGDLRPTRDFNYVEDTCRGFWDVAVADGVAGETFNVGSGTEISIGETFHLIQKLMGTKAVLVQDDQRIRPENSEVMRLVCDRSRLEKLTGHTPKVSLEEGLKRTIAWFTEPANLKHYKTDIYNV